MLCVVLYYKANLFHFSLLDGKEYFFVFSTKISSLLIVMEARNLFCYLHISRISTISSAVSCLQQPGVMTVLSAMARMMSSSRVIPISVKVVGRPTSRMKSARKSIPSSASCTNQTSCAQRRNFSSAFL